MHAGIGYNCPFGVAFSFFLPPPCISLFATSRMLISGRKISSAKLVELTGLAGWPAITVQACIFMLACVLRVVLEHIEWHVRSI